jgi:serine protease Do
VPASKSGDVLRELDGKRSIPNGSTLQVAVSEMTPGTAIELGILRDGKPQTLHITVGEFHKDSSEEAGIGEQGREQRGRLGLTVANLTPDLRQQFNVPDQVKGVVIQSVRPGSPAEDAGLAPGAVILGVDRHPVEDADSFVNQIHSEPASKDVLLLVWANGGQSYLVVHPDENSQNGE